MSPYAHAQIIHTSTYDEKHERLNQDYHLLTSVGVVVLLEGALSDGASAPYLTLGLLNMSRFDPRIKRAYFLHDILYQSGLVSRLEADKIFYEIMVQDGLDKFRASLLYRAVRLGGSKHYRSDSTKQDRRFIKLVTNKTDMSIPSHIDTRQEVETYALQVGLEKLGYDPKGLDGKHGKNTESALQALVNAVVKNKNHPVTPLPLYAQIAHGYIGVAEVAGSKSNSTILGWIKKQLGWGDDDSKIAWCAIFINEMLEQAGLKGTGKANARSFLNWGKKVTAPRKGDIIVFWRESPDSWKGHVGIYMGDADQNYVYCLGGNQANKVSIARYAKSSILGYRRLD